MFKKSLVLVGFYILFNGFEKKEINQPFDSSEKYFFVGTIKSITTETQIGEVSFRFFQEKYECHYIIYNSGIIGYNLKLKGNI